MDQIFDTIIIGAGPAGLSAALYAVRKNLKVLLIAKLMGGNATLAPQVENYLGFTIISGAQLAQKFKEDIVRYEGEGLHLFEGREVMEISGSFGDFKVKTDEGKIYGGKTVIIASGRVPKLLGIPGEKEFFGKGVAICATCDAPLYKGKEVAVIGGGNSALGAVLALKDLASLVTVVNIGNDLAGDSILLSKVKGAANVKILNNHQAMEILGEQRVSGLKVKDLQSGKETILSIEGVFIEVGYTPSTSFDHLTRKDNQGAIIVNDSGATSVTGIWAAGDVNTLWGEQMIISAGEGAKTALAVASYLVKSTN